jgi:hypothetical protein
METISFLYLELSEIGIGESYYSSRVKIRVAKGFVILNPSVVQLPSILFEKQMSKGSESLCSFPQY